MRSNSNTKTELFCFQPQAAFLKLQRIELSRKSRCFTPALGRREKFSPRKIKATERMGLTEADFEARRGVNRLLELFRSPGAPVAWVTLCTLKVSFFPTEN